MLMPIALKLGRLAAGDGREKLVVGPKLPRGSSCFERPVFLRLAKAPIRHGLAALGYDGVRVLTAIIDRQPRGFYTAKR